MSDPLKKRVFLPQIQPILRDVLYLTSVLNSCINPFIYGVYYLTGIYILYDFSGRN
mgnify:CR=1 FL=1